MTSNLTLSEPCQADCEALLSFETRNRTFFERHINARPPEFYSRNGVSQSIDDAIADRLADRAFAYLVRDKSGQLVGRVNLTRVRRAHFHSAELGYRIAEMSTGRGIASAAVESVLILAFGVHSLARVEATARPENPGSQRVLERNGFSLFGRSTKSVEIHGEWFDLLHFERHARVQPALS